MTTTAKHGITASKPTVRKTSEWSAFLLGNCVTMWISDICPCFSWPFLLFFSGSWLCSFFFFSPFYAHFLESFYHKKCWILSKAFSASIEMIIWFLFFNLLIWCITMIDLHILKNSCIPGINPTWSWCMSFLMCCWILFASILLRIFASIFNSDIGL